MDLGSLPVWAQQLSALIVTLMTAIGLRWAEKRKLGRVDEVTPQGNGEAQVVAASFVEKRLMERLIEMLGAMNANIVIMNGHMEKVNERMHEDEIVRAAVARMKEGRQ